MKDFNAINLDYLKEMKNRLLNIKCGLNFIKRIRIKRYIKSINLVENHISKSGSNMLNLVDRWFIDDLEQMVIILEM